MKKNTIKNALYSGLLLIVFLVAYWCRRPDTVSIEKKEIQIEGSTMGTTYHITYFSDDGRSLKHEVDSILIDFNQSLSTYIPDSEISLLNRDAIHKFKSPYLYPVLQRSKDIYDATDGAFDPTVMPLVQAWGFGSKGKGSIPDSAEVQRLLKFVSYDSIFFDTASVCKMHVRVQLDMSAIAKGYGVDVVAEYLKTQNINDMMVEIGGEVRCHGLTSEGKPWAIGIDHPSVQGVERELSAIIYLNDKALASSGNYRNFYEVDGVKYAHTISPFTGYPVQHTLLSASVIADDCMTADAYATAFMVLGYERSRQIIEATSGLDAYLIYNDEQGEYQTYASPDMNQMIKEVKK